MQDLVLSTNHTCAPLCLSLTSSTNCKRTDITFPAHYSSCCTLHVYSWSNASFLVCVVEWHSRATPKFTSLPLLILYWRFWSPYLKPESLQAKFCVCNHGARRNIMMPYAAEIHCSAAVWTIVYPWADAGDSIMQGVKRRRGVCLMCIVNFSSGDLAEQFVTLSLGAPYWNFLPGLLS